MGYAGGTTPDPTYQDIGDHSEALQIDFDPEVISYEELLDEFFSAHNPCRAAFSRQYRSAIFPHDEEQARAARSAALATSERRGDPVATDIEPFRSFTLAEDYHQKYRLRAEPQILNQYQRLFPDLDSFLDSTAVTRANAFVAGHGDERRWAEDLPRLGLSVSLQARFR